MGMGPRKACAPFVTSDERGTVTVEYTVLLALVVIGVVFATLSLGPILVRAFVARETWLLLPFP